jgi:SAM-dependent methyltransferase
MTESSLDYFLQKEQKIIDDLLAQHFGYYLLHFNKFNCLDTSASKISHQISYSNDIKYGTNILGEDDQISFKSDSIDFILMPHYLDYLSKKSDQKDVLSEVYRVLRPDGACLITCFNKLRAKSKNLSKNLSGKLNNKNNIKSNLISLSNRVDQLNKLNFKVIKAISFSLSLPSNIKNNNNNKSQNSWGYDFLTESKGMPSYFCLGYVILVKKKVVEVLPLKPKWSRVPRAAKSLLNKKRGPAQNNVKRINDGD